MPIVKLLVGEGADVNLQDKLGSTPLHRACGPGHVDVVKTLIQSANHLDIDASDDWKVLCKVPLFLCHNTDTFYYQPRATWSRVGLQCCSYSCSGDV